MDWDLTGVDVALKEGIDVRGRIAIVTHTSECRQGLGGTYQEIKAGESVMVTGVVESQKRNWWSPKLVTVFVDGRTVSIEPNKLVLVDPKNLFEKKAFAITGTLNYQREYYKSLIKLKGGVWKNSMSNSVDILIIGAGTRAQPTTKYKKAIKLGKRIIKENELQQLLQS